MEFIFDKASSKTGDDKIKIEINSLEDLLKLIEDNECRIVMDLETITLYDYYLE